MRRQPWQPVQVNSLDRAEYGRTERAWKHESKPAILLLHRPRSRSAKWFDRIALWCIVVEGVLVLRRAAYGRRIKGVPWRWVNRVLREHAGTPLGSSCHIVDGRRPTVLESITALPTTPGELPPVLVGHHRHAGRCDCAIRPVNDVDVPMCLPLAPPDRTLARRYRDHVVSQEEYAIYVDRWRDVMNEHPEYRTEEGKVSVAALCLASVRLHRAELVVISTHGRRLQRPFHKMFVEAERLRASMGVTRRQREMQI